MGGSDSIMHEYGDLDVYYRLIDMNKIVKQIGLVVALLSTMPAVGKDSVIKTIRAQYDERIELMSVICHLAEFDEYNMNLGGMYIAEVDSFFANVKNHPVVELMDSLRQNNGISFDSPMAFAVNLQKDGNQFSLVCDTLVPERRWNGVDLQMVTENISDFYTTSNFGKFFDSHKPFYKEICEVFNSNVISKFNQNWYEQFYGTEPKEQFEVIIGFVNGGANYGPSRQLPGKPRDVFAIMGYALDENGESYYSSEPQNYLTTLVHEFNHSFVNPLADDPRFKSRMRQPAETMYRLSLQVMRNSAYASWANLVNESIVRAAVIRYLIDNNTQIDDVRKSVIDEMSVGFYWTPELVKCLSKYSENRDKYPTLADYYPVIIEFFDEYTQKREAAIDDAVK